MSFVVAIAGSPSIFSKSSALLQYAACQLKQVGMRTDILSVRDLPAEDLLYGYTESAALQDALTRVEYAQGVLVATPVYKASYTGVLKLFLDLLPQNAFADKVVLPIVTGGSPGHQLAMDYALKPVLSALGARHILQGVYVPDVQIQFEHGGALDLDCQVERRLREALTDLSREARRLSALVAAPDWEV